MCGGVASGEVLRELRNSYQWLRQAAWRAGEQVRLMFHVNVTPYGIYLHSMDVKPYDVLI